MRFIALATDYDGTLATDGQVQGETLDALKAFSETGRKLILVTGRKLDDLFGVFPQSSLFDMIVAENGALLYSSALKEEKLIAPEPHEGLVKLLKEKKVEPLDVGKSIIATWHPNETTVLECIQELGLEHQVIFNKGAVMILPPGVNKATGLQSALKEMGLSRHNVVGIGDAENDLAFLSICECSVAVANALTSVKSAADLTTQGNRGAGVSEILLAVLENDLEKANEKLGRHAILLGWDQDDKSIFVEAYGSGLLIAGTSSSGKSTAVGGILERLADKQYQFCLIDPEGDFESFEKGVSCGSSQHAPTDDEILQILKDPSTNVIVNLLGIPLADRPAFLGRFLPRVRAMHNSLGRPHWIIIDEAHHMLPNASPHVMQASAEALVGTILITVHPDEIAADALATINSALILGQQPAEMLAKVAIAYGDNRKIAASQPLAQGEAFFWPKGQEIVKIKIAPGHTERRRHLRKYAEGDVGEEKSFYFTGADNKLKLRVQNLILFVQISEGIDDQTWLYHLHKAHYSKWFAEAIKDEELSSLTASIEEDRALSAGQSKSAVQALIKERYTAPAVGPHLNSENILS